MIPACNEYTSGSYYDVKHLRHKKDAQFKAENFVDLFARNASLKHHSIQSYIDVGCGAGDVVQKVSASLVGLGYDLKIIKGYDVAPQVADLTCPGINYICGDFCRSDDSADLITLFDVVEHVPDPVQFLRDVSCRADLVGLNIPLENTLNYSIRDKYRRRIVDPGHILYVDIVGALNLLCYAGLRVIDYKYVNNFMAPTGHLSVLSKVILPARYALFKINPWLLSRTLGGVSLMIVAATPRGVEKGMCN